MSAAAEQGAGTGDERRPDDREPAVSGPSEPELMPRAIRWAQTHAGHRGGGDQIVQAHADTHARLGQGRPSGTDGLTRQQREDREELLLAPGATRSIGAGDRLRPEDPDPVRTCFERDRDRIVHSAAFRRLAGKTQVVVYPRDHQRTRLTHALEVAQVATSIARGVGANVTLADAMALGHDCGHGPGGHASEDAFDAYLPDGFDHGPWGADVVLAPLNLCAQTLDGIRNHSWSRPAPGTIEGEICSWADRIAYCAHDFEDAVHAGIVGPSDLPRIVTEQLGSTRSSQLGALIGAVISTTCATGSIGMDADHAAALAALRAFNYERIYTRADSVAQARAVVEVLQGLVEYYRSHPDALPAEYARTDDHTLAAVTYVGGMTDRFAFEQAAGLLGWAPERLPRGIGRGA